MCNQVPIRVWVCCFNEASFAWIVGADCNEKRAYIFVKLIAYNQEQLTVKYDVCSENCKTVNMNNLEIKK